MYNKGKLIEGYNIQGILIRGFVENEIKQNSYYGLNCTKGYLVKLEKDYNKIDFIQEIR